MDTQSHIDHIIPEYPDTEQVSYSDLSLTVRYSGSLTSGARGSLLMHMEHNIRIHTGAQISVFLEPKGDINKLRTRLRGVKV